ncbi:type VI secretion system ATPase TssH [Burkholderia humptydooensis]|uniref:Type VI secretion system ATPase TssH n=4 Tax=Burkholderia humptydooensis TaxID=430531 RepID=A0A7U4SUQ5_9BURK|nr:MULTISPECIES: type VI secretion system ATPase TssH [Burkholderia]AJY38591.1 type VI secretion ATPase, ClpV1 family [Burkholderia sp. 2002721687]ALX45400.1 ClpV1 family T6SS ATPase [Burkholderia humptydooensis]EIP85403.1 chaperone ClpB [Burkholderia humptydooensis MSMB43]QPS46872.1 type VI secretion system ATPase TssH [Burkholderia humptydooensis]
MLLVDLKPLIEQLNPYCRTALENAVGACVARRHDDVAVEHLLARLCDEPSADVALLLRASGADAARLRRQADAALDARPAGGGARPAFAPSLLALLQDAWLIASLELGETHIRSAAVLAAAVARAARQPSPGGEDVLQSLRKDALVARFASGACAQSIESSRPAARDAAPGDANDAHDASSAIARYCEDFTAKARAGRIDPVFGRDAEIRQIVDILARRRKNNPVCVGEPGVGKTAVVEGLALRIAEGDVPATLRGATLLGLDLGLLQAGASVKGEFEQRLKRVIAEIRASQTPVVLFVDEAHTLIGAGGPAGASDAANLLKPALARGELRTIAATTWSEYKKHFEKDAALARRFQPVKLDSPDVATSVMILRGLKDRYQDAHGVTIRDDALVAAAELSARYITGRQLPDKAIDLLDTACARVKVRQQTKPAALEDAQRAIQALERERRALRQELAERCAPDTPRVADIDREHAALSARADALRDAWAAQRDAAQALVGARRACRAAADAAEAADAVDVADVADVADIADVDASAGAAAAASRAHAEPASHADARERAARAHADATRRFEHAQRDARLVRIDVDPDAIADVVADWTGIAAGKLRRDRANVMLRLADTLRRRIRGQDHAIGQIAQAVKTGAAGVRDPRRPLGVFLLAGPSGTGKTETALAVADALFGDERSIVVVNMSEFQERHDVSRLIGSPPGYVGYGEGGMLTEAVRQRPYSVVLLDEVEKAHPDVLNLFYQVFDKGTLSDGEGKEVDFANTVIFLTSNLGADAVADLAAHGARPDPDAMRAAIRPALSRHFKPALLARMTEIPYATLAPDALADIARLKLERIAARVAAQHATRVVYDDAVVAHVAARCTEVESGARNVDFILQRHVLPALAQHVLVCAADATQVAAIRVAVDADGRFAVSADGPAGGDARGASDALDASDEPSAPNAR